MSSEPSLHIGRRIAFALLLLVLTVVSIWHAGNQPDDSALLRLDGGTMGTSWQVQVARSAVNDPDNLHGLIQARLDTLDNDIFSTWSSDSELSRFNQAQAPVSQPVSREMAVVTAMARQVHEQSGGAFEPTIAPLVNLWGFGPDFSTADIPAEADIDRALAELGFDAIELEDADTDNPVLHRELPRELDYSAIAKGFAVDEVAALLEARGIRSFLVEVGGELLVNGRRPDGNEWRLGIERPQAGQRSVFQAIGNGGERLAIAASGDYRNHFELDDQRYSHAIDPTTGWPVSHSLVSVTVLDTSAAMADAWATAFMIMGPERSRRLATGRQMPVYLIMRSGSGHDSWFTPAFEPYLRELSPASSQSPTAVQDTQ